MRCLDYWSGPIPRTTQGEEMIRVGFLERLCLRLVEFSLVRISNDNMQNSWVQIIRTVWQINPAIAVHLPERFKSPIVRNEVTKLVRSSTLEALDVPEALPFLLGDRLDPKFHRDFKVIMEPGLTCLLLTPGKVSYSMGTCSTYHCQRSF
jgi:hypothetical protein